jgi:uncharacterized protein (TIGR02246 family)
MTIADDAGAATDRTEIERLAAAFTDSWNSHDMARFASLFADNADFVNVVGMWWKNREEIQQAHAYSHSTFFKNSRLSGQIAGLKFLRPDLATVHILWELVGQIEPDGSVGQPRKGVLLLVCGKQDGAWHIQSRPRSLPNIVAHSRRRNTSRKCGRSDSAQWLSYNGANRGVGP